ncbi:polyisoprenoid-binding protein [Oceanobacillus piezotolerans]|uniref:Polyisoprenoid-binding protein n=1 Tax=Oceanobacillus piezotolerans TaxID=2448030 RepID=A0A498DBN6_9BACI|nr:YceI family protein [Oceanobacillus piezotolerans]RLL45153.1 polyisoprenoid-binding protein [Oceanobacillus piezotolerans]
MAKSTWTVDTAHSEIGFVVKHMMISKAKGTFDQFEAVIEADVEDLSNSKIEVTIDTASVNTRNDARDEHLRSADFFDAENHPKMTFVATDIKKKSDKNYDVIGDLSIKDTTKPVTVDVTFEGISKDPMSGDTVAGFSGETVINRKDFGLTWNAAVETGGVLVAEDVKIQVELEVHKQG